MGRGAALGRGTAAGSLGDLLGELDSTELDAEEGYAKRHSSRSFTHAAIDMALELRGPDDPDEVLVETHSLAAGLDRDRWDGPLSAMFSLPFTVATALRRATLDPATRSPEALADPATADLDARPCRHADPRRPAGRGACGS